MKKLEIKLKELLESRGKTQAELADAIGVRRATINDLYHNRSKQIPRNVVDKIAEELNITDINEILSIVSDDGE